MIEQQFVNPEFVQEEVFPPQFQYDIPNDPTEPLPFELVPQPVTDYDWSFAPEYYPNRFPHTKDRKLTRTARQCVGEDISIKKTKNREFHIAGTVLASEIAVLNRIIDFEDSIDMYSPISPSGGIECLVKNGEVDATPSGFNPAFRMWEFDYTLDLVSTGRDEYGSKDNSIVSAILDYSDQSQASAESQSASEQAAARGNL